MEKGEDEPLLIDAREAARLLKVTPITIYRMAKTGQLPSMKVGRLLRFSRAKLEEWVERKFAGGRGEGG